MHSQLTEYETGFRDVRDDAIALTEDVNPDRLRASPGPDRWSVVQIFDHMNTSGELLLGEIEPAIEDGRENGPYGDPPFEYGFMSRWWISLLQPSGWDIPAPSETEPPASETLSPTEVIEEFCTLQDRFRDCVLAADGLDLRRIRLGSPALPLVQFSLGAWFEAHIGHEQRHLVQARETLNDLDGEKVKGRKV